MDFGILCLLWPSNSLDLNMIKLCWPWMKLETTRTKSPQNCKKAGKNRLNVGKIFFNPKFRPGFNTYHAMFRKFLIEKEVMITERDKLWKHQTVQF